MSVGQERDCVCQVVRQTGRGRTRNSASIFTKRPLLTRRGPISSVIRAGEHEGFFEKIKQPAWRPDFGAAVFNERAGATVIGVRDFLVAYNINLNTKSVRRANSVAFDVREAGRFKTDDGTPTGKKVLDEKGQPVRIPGMLKHVKGIGWFVEEYGIAQVSMNLTNISENAAARGL